MKSFSLKGGPASKGFFGPNAQTLGSPFPPVVSHGSPLTWTNRGIVSTHAFYGVASDTAGNTLTIDSTGQVFKSTDGGHTWALVTTIAGFSVIQNLGPFITAGGTWILCTGGTVWRSTNLGVSWVSHLNNVNNAGGTMLATNGAGTWLGVGNVGGPLTTVYAHSIDDGVTWTAAANVTAISGAGPPFNIAFDGTRFFFSGGTTLMWETIDTINWTSTPVVNGSIQSLLFTGGKYYGADSAKVFTGASITALLADPGTTIPGLFIAPTSLLKAGSNFFITDLSHGVDNSQDFANWFAGTSNIPGGGSFAGASYDSVHNSAIGVCSNGAVVTFP